MNTLDDLLHYTVKLVIVNTYPGYENDDSFDLELTTKEATNHIQQFIKDTIELYKHYRKIENEEWY